ncbi:WD40-repeat-containing domain protein [Spinellus fusiger]|nr:WD40-repeat-containing domain protein [Spinellus fusiger]
MTWGVLDGSKQLLVGRESGKLQYLSPETGEIVREFRDASVGTEQGRLIGLYANETHLASCSSTGEVSYTLLSSFSSSSPNNTTSIASLGAGLHVMRGHPLQNHIFATGGKERDLCVYDATVLAAQKEAHKTSTDKSTPTTGKAKKGSQEGLLFQAKNVKNDFLDLQQPVWIRDIQFISQDTSKIAVGTHYHQIRIYDVKAARRPVLNVEIGKSPITTVRMGKEDHHLMFTDTLGNVGTMDIRTGGIVARYKGYTGAVTDLAVVPQSTFIPSPVSDKPPVMVSVSLDRFLRVHEMSSIYRKCVHKAYLKQRLTSVLVDESYEHPLPEVDQSIQAQNKEEDDMWNALPKVNSSNKKKRALQ